GDERASFAIALTKDGAALFATALDRGLSLVHLRYDLAFLHHLDGIELRVWCDGHKAAETASARLRAGTLDPAAFRDGLLERKIAGIEITQEATVPPEHIASLEALGRRILDAALESALFDFDAAPEGGADHGVAKDGKVGSVRPYRPS